MRRDTMTNLKETYAKKAIPQMMERFGYKTRMAVPRIKKVVLNTGFGKMVIGKTGEDEKKIREEIVASLALITGQRPMITTAKKSVSGFKLRKGVPIGAKATLRGSRMYDFLDRLINIMLPRSRDFQGIALKSFDGTGNLTIGVKEQVFFSEIAVEKIKVPFGLEITIATNAKKREESVELFRTLGFPLKK